MKVDSNKPDDVKRLYLKVGKLAASKADYIVGNKQMAEDIMQESFLKLFQSKIIFNNEKSAYKWVYVSTHNLAIDYMRSKKNKPYTDVHSIDFENPVSEEQRIQNRETLRNITSKLTGEETSLLAYKHIDGLSTGQIASLEGFSERTLRRKFEAIRVKIEEFIHA